MSSTEKVLFKKGLAKVGKLLKAMGIQIKENDFNRDLLSRIWNRKWYVFNMLWLASDATGEIFWLLLGIYNRESFVQLIYVIPCITIVILGVTKAYYFIKYHHYVLNIINTIKKLQNADIQSGTVRKEIDNELIKKRYPYMNYTMNMFSVSNFAAISGFVSAPLIITASNYFLKGKVKLLLPFLIKYPFNSEDIRIWPFVFLHQVWSGCITTTTVQGPDNFFYCCCTFIHIQLRALHYDLERIISQGPLDYRLETNHNIRLKLIGLVNRHQELIRCIDLLEIIFSKSTLINVTLSSTLICLTGFNIMAQENIFLSIPFLGFCSMTLLQIYFFCRYGDMIMSTSMRVSDAVFNCAWYRGSNVIIKELMIIAMRATKPCKMTAFGFADISLRTFMRIMSSTWSYFALLKTMYRK